MSTSLGPKRERYKIFKNFIENCIEVLDGHTDREEPVETFPTKIFENVINDHIKLLTRIIKSISSDDRSFDELEHIHDFIIEYFKNKKEWDSQHFNRIYKVFSEFLEKDIKQINYFTPLYNFKANFEEFLINDQIIIRKIHNAGKKWLEEKYENYTPVRTMVYDLTYIMIIKIEKNSKDPSSEAKQNIKNTVNLLRIFKKGDLRTGGLYYFQKSEKWNPKNKITRITYEPIGIHSTKKFEVKSSEKIQIIKFFKNASKCYPKIENQDYFDRSIRRFSQAIAKDDLVEKILDFVISLESLLVSGVGDSTLKLSQRAAILISKNDNEIVENFEFMKMCYNFRSGIVHESAKREFKVKNLGTLSGDQVVSRLEDSSRRIINKMIKFSQLSANSNLSQGKLTEKIDELLLNRNSWKKYKSMS